jgi:hypothetical protein
MGFTPRGDQDVSLASKISGAGCLLFVMFLVFATVFGIWFKWFWLGWVAEELLRR